MQFLILPTNKDSKEMYTNHGTYNPGDSGLDLFITKDITIKPGETQLVDLGIQSQLRSWNWLKFKWVYHSYMLFPRSSISKTPLILANSIGLVDSGYTGNIKAALYNHSKNEFTLKKGERYVQLVRPDLGGISFKLVTTLRGTQRGSGGFGSTTVQK
jgi:dUTP pyrophosphatase